MVQYARPISDVQVNSLPAGNLWWAGAGVSQTNLYQEIDEVVLDTADFDRFKSVGSETYQYYKTKLSTISKPLDMESVNVSVTSKRSTTNYAIRIYLKYGSTSIKDWWMPADTSATTNVTTLSSSEASSIQSAAEAAGDDDWEDLRLWFESDDDFEYKTGYIYQAFLQAGDAGGDVIAKCIDANDISNGGILVKAPDAAVQLSSSYLLDTYSHEGRGIEVIYNHYDPRFTGIEPCLDCGGEVSAGAGMGMVFWA